MPFSAKCLPIAAMAFLCLTYLASAETQKEDKPADNGHTIRAQVEMVSLPVVVTGRHGEYITDLKKEDFRIYEDGVLQDIAGFAAVEEPISVALLLDTSNSTELQLTRIKNEAERFVELLREDDGLAILSFADQVILWEHFDIYRKKNAKAIQRIKPGGLSAVYEAVWLALEQVLKQEYGRKALVLFSDGVDTRRNTVSKEETLQLARKTDATIYCIYFNTAKDRNKRLPRVLHPLLESSQQMAISQIQWPPVGRNKRPEDAAGLQYMLDLAKYSGGILVDASRTGDLGSAFGKIAKELSSQYSLGYYPGNLIHDAHFHRVEVKLNRPGLSARTKAGYYAF
jgi:Ca-activated chloride channel family protein